MPNQHKVRAFTFRPETEDDREWLLAHAEKSGRPVNAVLREALSDLREKIEKENKLVRLRRELDIVTAVLETADDTSVEPYQADTEGQQ
jgi:predicted NAD-dependent protein-ADP-ribosyltransferase YbiA (DUF1768 family)